MVKLKSTNSQQVLENCYFHMLIFWLSLDISEYLLKISNLSNLYNFRIGSINRKYFNNGIIVFNFADIHFSQPLCQFLLYLKFGAKRYQFDCFFKNKAKNLIVCLCILIQRVLTIKIVNKSWTNNFLIFWTLR